MRKAAPGSRDAGTQRLLGDAARVHSARSNRHRTTATSIGRACSSPGPATAGAFRAGGVDGSPHAKTRKPAKPPLPPGCCRVWTAADGDRARCPRAATLHVRPADAVCFLRGTALLQARLHVKVGTWRAPAGPGSRPAHAGSPGCAPAEIHGHAAASRGCPGCAAGSPRSAAAGSARSGVGRSA